MSNEVIFADEAMLLEVDGKGHVLQIRPMTPEEEEEFRLKRIEDEKNAPPDLEPEDLPLDFRNWLLMAKEKFDVESILDEMCCILESNR